MKLKGQTLDEIEMVLHALAEVLERLLEQVRQEQQRRPLMTRQPKIR
jgi:hypothetical protein